MKAVSENCPSNRHYHTLNGSVSTLLLVVPNNGVIDDLYPHKNKHLYFLHKHSSTLQQNKHNSMREALVYAKTMSVLQMQPCSVQTHTHACVLG